MTNLDKLLKKVERNSLKDENREIKTLVVAGEKYEVLSMTRKQKKNFIYSQKAGQEIVAGDLIKSFIPIIYDCFQLQGLATKAKDAGYIKSYYDVVDTLFEPNELIEIVTFLVEENGIGEGTVEEVMSDAKK